MFLAFGTFCSFKGTFLKFMTTFFSMFTGTFKVQGQFFAVHGHFIGFTSKIFQKFTDRCKSFTVTFAKIFTVALSRFTGEKGWELMLTTTYLGVS